MVLFFVDMSIVYWSMEFGMAPYTIAPVAPIMTVPSAHVLPLCQLFVVALLEVYHSTIFYWSNIQYRSHAEKSFDVK